MICEIHASEILGDWLFMQKNYELAQEVFSQSSCYEKLIQSLIKLARQQRYSVKLAHFLAHFQLPLASLKAIFEELLSSYPPIIAGRIAMVLVNEGAIRSSDAIYLLNIPRQQGISDAGILYNWFLVVQRENDLHYP
jgi:hypothetical protein